MNAIMTQESCIYTKNDMSKHIYIYHDTKHPQLYTHLLLQLLLYFKFTYIYDKNNLLDIMSYTFNI